MAVTNPTIIAPVPDTPGHQLPAGPQDSDSTLSSGEVRYSEKELGMIFKRAAELQEDVQTTSGARFTLAEIQQIGAEVGISPRNIAVAAAGLSSGGGVGTRHLFYGAPTKFRFQETIEGEMTDDAVGALLDIARRELGLQGKVTEALGSIEWLGRDSMGATYVTVTRRSGRTTIGVMSFRTDAAAVTGVLGITGGILGSIALGAFLGASIGVFAPAAAAIGIVGAGGSSWMSIRTAWKRYARRYTEHTRILGADLVLYARQSINDRQNEAKKPLELPR